jgi:hypothetical protein
MLLIQQDLESEDAEKLTKNLQEIKAKIKNDKPITSQEAVVLVNSHSDKNSDGWFGRKMSEVGLNVKHAFGKLFLPQLSNSGLEN